MCWMCNLCWAHKRKLMRMIVVDSVFQEFWSKTKPFLPTDCQIKVSVNVGEMRFVLWMVRLSCRCALCVQCVYTFGAIVHQRTKQNVKSIQITDIRIHVHVFLALPSRSRFLWLSPFLSFYRNRALIVTFMSRIVRFSLPLIYAVTSNDKTWHIIICAHY